jgi:hypothetical protein
MNPRKKTKPSGISLICTGLLLLIILKTPPGYCQNPQLDIELMKQSSIIFVGTVSKMKAVSFPRAPVSENTAVVKVELLLQSPPTISIKSGQEVTVRLKDPSSLSTGTKAIFYTDGWILGDGIALREVGHATVPRVVTLQADEQTKKSFIEAKRQLTDKKLLAQIESSDVVALGKVINIRPSLVAAQQRKFITEHDPEWLDAEIEVQEGIKGVANGGRIVVRFPGSEDVAFFGVPKFKLNDERMFLLKKDKITGLPKALVAGAQVETFVVEKPLDVLPKEERDRVRQIFRTIR